MDKYGYYKESLRNFFTSKWFFIFLFLFALFPRGFAASRISITNIEAENLLFLSDSFENFRSTYSPIHHLYFRIIDFLFVRNLLALRFLSVVSGSMAVLLPYLFRNQLGQTSASWLALFLLLDPFLNANSVLAVSYSMTILLSAFLIFSLVKEKINKVVVFAFALFLSGPGSIFLIVGILLFFLSVFLIRKKSLVNFLKSLKEKINIQSLDKSKIALALLFLIAVVFFIFQNDGGISLGFQPFFEHLPGPYGFGNYPVVYPFLIIGYLPFFIFTIFLSSSNSTERIRNALPFWIAVFFLLLFIMVNPGHQYYDLVWISIPMAVLSAEINEFKDLLYSKNQPLSIILFCIGVTSLLINIAALINSIQAGAFYTDVLATIGFILLLISAGVIFLGYLFSYCFAWKIFRTSLLVVFLIIQIGISFRSLAVGNKPERELVWNGYFQDKEIIIPLYNEIKKNFLGTSGSATIEIEETANPALLWYLAGEKIRYGYAAYLGDSNFVFSGSTGFLENRKDFFQQEFVMESYPKWTWHPVRSFLSADFWSWFFWRDGQLSRQYYSMFVRNDLFYTSYDGSELNR